MNISSSQKSLLDGSLNSFLTFLLKSAIGLPPSPFQCIENPPYLLELFLAYFFLFSHVKEALAEQKLTVDSLKSAWVGVTATAAKEANIAEVCEPYECRLMWIQLGGNHAKKTLQNTCPPKMSTFVLFSMSGFRPNTPRIYPYFPRIAPYTQ